MARKSSKTTKITSVTDFISKALQWKHNGRAPTAFRGQKFYNWPTLPKIFRPDLGISEQEHKIVREISTLHPDDFTNDATSFERLVRMQHYGLPTRLLDVTQNPLVALWFASEECTAEEVGPNSDEGESMDGKVQAFFVPERRDTYFDSDRVSLLANMSWLNAECKEKIWKHIEDEIDEFNKLPEVDKLFYQVSLERPSFRSGRIDPNDLKLPLFVRPKLSNKRILAQFGAFVIYGREWSSRKQREKVDEKINMHVRRYLIPAEHKEKIRGELARLGVHANTLFPEIESTANVLIKRFKMDS
ncbi:FRG domain-containing protein [uncultured Cohaesibacter sp.]|uniref:FRG domain-containing protein n=1 Tax=uncultured Cohaesibacter sp. TaxID=1002546 RepID=UPI002AA7CE69|nr:FRG domain-containing protein [uncultured Cohaesibacter sp.]